METTSVSAFASAGSSTTSGTSAKELENQFLTLLVAQLKNQDPTKPVENEEFVAQLAQLEALDQQQKLAETNQNLLLQSSLATGASLIGGTVEGHSNVGGEQVSVTGQVSSIRVENGEVVLQVERSGGSTVSMPVSNIISVRPTELP